MPSSKLSKYKLDHLFFWLLVFGAWYFLRYQDYSRTSTALTVTLIKVLDLALMVYLTNYILLPKLFYKKKYGWFILVFVLMIVASSTLKMNILGRVMNAPQYYSLGPGLKQRIYDNVIPHFFLVIAGAAVKLMIDYSRLQRRLAETAREKAEAELNFLKSQINPHFLFNSLNSVYFLIDKQNAAARESLHKFSDMLRYQLYEMNGAKIPVEREIHYLKDYVDLQRLRKDEHYQVSFNYDVDVNGFSIEPLLLIPFVENAFKHISHHNSDENFIRMEMSRSNGTFHFDVENSVEEGKTSAEPGGIGLANVRRRLELLYPGKHDLKIEKSAGIFKVRLSLAISEESENHQLNLGDV